MDRLLDALNRAGNNNVVINTLLLGMFGALAARSTAQQRAIEELEAEKDALLKANKGIKSAMWEWKQQLYAEVEANPNKALVPLSTIKSIYGDVANPKSPALSGPHFLPEGSDDQMDGKSPAPKFVI